MYSLPISPYSDYWRATKLWGKLLGGTATLVVGTTVLTLPEATFPQVFDIPISSVGQILNGDSNKAYEGTAITAPAKEKMTVKVRITDHIEPYETVIIESNQIPAGMSRVQQAGTEGKKRKVVRTVSIDGEEDFQIIYQFELEKPKKRVIIQNTTPVLDKNIDVSRLRIKESFIAEATAYTHTGYKTASGLEPRVGLIAVDPKVIPLGTMLYVEGYGYAVAADTGGAIKGKKVDVFFDTLNECIQWGRKSVYVYVLSSIE